MSQTATASRAGVIEVLRQRAYKIRRHALRMGEVQGQGYVGQALGIADVLAVSYFHALKLDPKNPDWEGRDRFLILPSNSGHSFKRSFGLQTPLG
jgi:transketolase